MISQRQAARLLSYLRPVPGEPGVSALTNSAFRSAGVQEHEILGMPFHRPEFPSKGINVGGETRWCAKVDDEAFREYAGSAQRAR